MNLPLKKSSDNCRRGQAMLVTIITITCNSEKYMEETIKSVVFQDYPEIEYIIIDGGSTDGTLDIVNKYRGMISKVVSEPDEGIADAMNKGIRMASGEIIGMIHSDDFYSDPTVIRRVVDVFETSGQIKAVYGIQDLINPETGDVILTWGRAEEPSEIKKRMYIPHPTLFVSREVYDAIGLFRKDYRVAMDYEFSLRLTKYTKPHFLNYKIACMRDMGESGKQFSLTLEESVRALFEHGYYVYAAAALVRNIVKRLLVRVGLRKVLYKLWERNVSPGRKLSFLI